MNCPICLVENLVLVLLVCVCVLLTVEGVQRFADPLVAAVKCTSEQVCLTSMSLYTPHSRTSLHIWLSDAQPAWWQGAQLLLCGVWIRNLTRRVACRFLL